MKMRNILLYFSRVILTLVILINLNSCSANKKIEIPHLKKIPVLIIAYDTNKTDIIISNKDFTNLINNYRGLKDNNTLCNNYFNTIKLLK